MSSCFFFLYNFWWIKPGSKNWLRHITQYPFLVSHIEGLNTTVPLIFLVKEALRDSWGPFVLILEY